MAHGDSVIVRVPFVSVWDGGVEIGTSANVNMMTGGISDIAASGHICGLEICERQYVVMNDEQVNVYEGEHGFDYWADISGEFNN